jgi:hypothetical protein
VRTVNVYLGNGTDTVFVGELYDNLDHIQAPVNVNGGAGYDTMNIGDFNNQNAENWQLGSTFVTRSGAGTINCSAMNQVDIYGNGANTTNGLTTYNVAQTSYAKTYLFVYLNSTVNVRGTSGELDIIEGEGTNPQENPVNVGDNGNVRSIHGAVVITGTGSYARVTVDDSNDPADSNVIMDTYTPAGDTVYDRVTFSGLAPISTRAHDTVHLNVFTGTGSVTCSVHSDAPLGPPGLNGVVYLVGNSFQTAVNVGGVDGTVHGIQAPLYITNPLALTDLYVLDASDTSASSVTLEDSPTGLGQFGEIDGLSPAPIVFKYSDTDFVNVYTGVGGTNFEVLGTGVDTLVQVASVHNNVYVAAPAIQSGLAINSFSGSTSVTIDDIGDSSNPTATLDTYTSDTEHVRVSGLTPAPIDIPTHVLQSLFLDGGNGGDTFVVDSATASSFPTTIQTNYGNNEVDVLATGASPLSVYLTGGQNDTVNLGDANNGLALIQTPVTLVGNEIGDGDILNLIDQANPNPETYVVTNSTFYASDRQIVGHMENFDLVVLYPSLDPNTSVVDVHDPNLYTFIVSYDPPPDEGSGAGPLRFYVAESGSAFEPGLPPSAGLGSAGPVSDALTLHTPASAKLSVTPSPAAVDLAFDPLAGPVDGFTVV